MPIHEAVALVLVMAFFSVGTWGIISSILEHRREMAKMKFDRSDRQNAVIAENGDLRETGELMQDRIAVLEQIAIDPARRTADEIEKLR